MRLKGVRKEERCLFSCGRTGWVKGWGSSPCPFPSLSLKTKKPSDFPTLYGLFLRRLVFSMHFWHESRMNENGPVAKQVIPLAAQKADARP